MPPRLPNEHEIDWFKGRYERDAALVLFTLATDHLAREGQPDINDETSVVSVWQEYPNNPFATDSFGDVALSYRISKKVSKSTVSMEMRLLDIETGSNVVLQIATIEEGGVKRVERSESRGVEAPVLSTEPEFTDIKDTLDLVINGPVAV